MIFMIQARKKGLKLLQSQILGDILICCHGNLEK